MGQSVGIHTIVDWNQKKQEWDLHPKLWETEAGRQRISKALKVISVAGGVAAGLMASGVVGSFTVVVVTATGVAALVAYVAGRHFGFLRLDLWNDPEFCVKQGKAALQLLNDRPICIIKGFKKNHSRLLDKGILKEEDITKFIRMKFNQINHWTADSFIRHYGVEGFNKLPNEDKEKFKEQFLSGLVYSKQITSWTEWFDLHKHKDTIRNDSIEGKKIQAFEWERESLLKELCLRDMQNCYKEGRASHLTYPFIRQRNTYQQMQKCNQEQAIGLFRYFVLKSTIPFNDLSRDYSNEVNQFQFTQDDWDQILKPQLDKLDGTSQSYQAFREKNVDAIKGKLLTQKTVQDRVVPAAVDFFLNSGIEFNQLCEDIDVELEGLGLTKEDLAKRLVEVALKQDAKFNLSVLVKLYGLSPEHVNNDNRETLKYAFFQMEANRWADKKYAPFRVSLGIGCEDMLSKYASAFTFRNNFSQDVSTVLTGWKEEKILTDEQLRQFIENNLLVGDKPKYSFFSIAAFQALDENSKKQLQKQEIEKVIRSKKGFSSAKNVVKLSSVEDLARVLIPIEATDAQENFKTFYERNGIEGWNHLKAEQKQNFKQSFQDWVPKSGVTPNHFKRVLVDVASSLDLNGKAMLKELCTAEKDKLIFKKISYQLFLARCSEAITDEEKDDLRDPKYKVIKMQ